MEFVTRFKNALFLVTVLLAQAIALAMQVRGPATGTEPTGERVRLIRLWSIAAVSPFERAAHAISSGVRYTWFNYIDLRHARQENDALKRQIAQMRLDEAAIAEDALQDRRLQAMLQFRQRYVGSTVAAQVIGASASDQSHILTLDKGSNDGLKPDMAVISPDGIIGKIREVGPTTSLVVEINDQTSGAGVILESTRIRGILRGTVAGRVQIGNLTADSRIKPGEHVLTSGGDQVYPRGLPVGVIEKIEPDPDHQPYMAISVKPAADLNRVEEVLVITGMQSELSDQAQQDLLAAQAKRASDMSAEKLPGIHDGQPQDGAAAAGSAGSPAATQESVKVPRPIPVIHPDRYSPGATPPASNLTPGGASLPQQNPVPADSGKSSSAAPAQQETQ